MPRISVGIRIRPELGAAEKRIDGFNLHGENIELSVAGNQYNFSFDTLFADNASQEEVFKSSATTIIDSALEGYNGCIFAYGQTGAGKTHTMSGVIDGTASDHGICIRAAIHMFTKAQSLVDSFAFRLSILEIYNESLVDLLLPSIAESTIPINGANKAIKLNIMETESGMLVPGLHIMPIDSVDDTINHFVDAQANRAVAEHQLNHRSSRSHIIYTFYITRTQLSAKGAPTNKNGAVDDPIIHQSKLHLVDLAGSERVNKTGSSGIVQKEANYINRSLSYLEQVVIALGQSNRDHIPYRQSKLTYLLKDCLGGNCNTYMIACIWPKKDHSWETLSTLRFSSRMKCIETQPIRNRLVTKEQAPSRIIQQQLELLKKELALRDMIHHSFSSPPPVPSSSSAAANATLVGGGGTGAKDTSAECIWSIELTKQQKLRTYQHTYDSLIQNMNTFSFENLTLLPTTPTNDFHSLSQIQLTMNLYKAMIYKLSGQQEQVLTDTFAEVVYAHTADSIPLPRKQAIFQSNNNNNKIPATANTNNRQNNQNNQMKDINVSTKEENSMIEEKGPPSLGGGGGAGGALSLNIDSISEKHREEYFQEFISQSETGKHLHDAFEQSKETLKSNKQRQREIIQLLNEQKSIIDDIGQKLMHFGNDNEKGGGGGSEGTNEEGSETDMATPMEGKSKESFEQLRDQLEHAKKRYRTAHQELTICKEQIQETQQLKKRAMNAMLTAFNEYLTSMPIVEQQTY